MTRSPRNPGQLLSKLTRKRLLELARTLELGLSPRSRKAEILTALDSRSREAAELFDLLKDPELARVCRSVGLDGSGSRAEQLARLLELASSPPPEPVESRGPMKPVKPMPVEFRPVERAFAGPPLGPQETSSSDRLDKEQLKAHLWEAANILRGTVDSSDFRQYIFALLFYKRLSDVWEEELEMHGLAASGDGVDHRFQLPRRLLWNEVCGSTGPGVGARLNAAFAALERANPRLEGLFQEVNFAHRERFPDTTLERLLRHFEIHRLRNADVRPDMLGDAYEFLIAQFANDAGKKGGEFYTPKQVVRLLVECLDPTPGESVYDPTCGSGGMLLEAAEYVREYYQEDPSSLLLFGQERNLNTWCICRMNLLLHSIDFASVLRGDTLRSPGHLDSEGRLRTFDVVIANPPFSLKRWGHELWKAGDPFGRDVYGCPPPSYGDMAFLQHMLASLGPRGRAGVVLPHGALFRSHTERAIRRGLLEDDLVDSIISLPRNLFYGTSIPACIWILSKAKPESRKGRVLFVDGSREMLPGRNQNELSDNHVERLRDAYRTFSEEDGFSRVVEVSEIAANDYTLHLPFYVMPPEEEDEAEREDVERALTLLEEQQRQRNLEVEALFQEMGL